MGEHVDLAPIACYATLSITKGVAWSPDGSCLLSSAEDSILRLFGLPPSLMAQRPPSAADAASAAVAWTPYFSIEIGEAVHDFCWFPRMHTSEPASCCFLAACRGRSLALYDALYGSVRASYRAHDHLDEDVSALCAAFSPDGGRIFAGYDRCVRVFDTAREGLAAVSTRPTCGTRKDREGRGGQRGLVSSIAVAPGEGNLYAVGSYEPSLVLYDERRGDARAVAVLAAPADGPPLGGVTQLRFSPDGNHLFSASRGEGGGPCSSRPPPPGGTAIAKNGADADAGAGADSGGGAAIRCWDVRGTGDQV